MDAMPPPILVQTKPGSDVWAYGNPWTHKLCSCCNNIRICCKVCWCCPCVTYKIYRRLGENCLACCWPMTLWPLRTKMRTLFRIKGSICGDCATVQCCPCCVLVQMRRELDRRGL